MNSAFIKIDDLDKRIDQKLKALQQNYSAEDLRKKAMTLKVRANRQNNDNSSNFWETAEEEKTNEK